MFSWQMDDYNFLMKQNSESVTILYSGDFDSAYNVFNLFIENRFSGFKNVISLNGKSCRPGTQYLPFLNLFNENNVSFIKQLGKTILKDVTKSDTAALIYEKAVINKQNCELFDARIVGICNALNEFFKSRPSVIIISDFIEFDEYSAGLVFLLINETFQNLFPNLWNLKLYILCDNEENFKQLEELKKIAHAEYKLHVPDANELKEFISSEFNLLNILDEDYERFYKLCGGNLTYSEMLAKYLLETNDTEFINTDKTDIAYKVLSARIIKLGNIGGTVEQALNIAAEIGEDFTLRVLSNALNTDYDFDKVIEKCNKEYLIKKIDEERSKFYYPVIWKFFLEKASEKLNSRSFIALERAIYADNPQDYLTRAVFYQKAGDERAAAEMYLLEYCKAWISGKELKSAIVSIIETFCRSNNLFVVYNNIKCYFKAIKENHFKTASECFGYGDYSSERLQALKFFLTGYALYRFAATPQELQIALGKINRAEEISKRVEKGLWSDCVSFLISLNLNINGDLTKATELYDELFSYYETLKSTEAEVQLNILKRKSASILSVERALLRTEESAAFFENTFYISEYLMALNNYAANSFFAGELPQARTAISKAADILFDLPIGIANNNYILNNYLIIDVLFDYKNCEDAARSLETYLNKFEDASWKIIPLINCAIFNALNANYPNAEHLLNKAEELNDELQDDYYEYYININRAPLYYLQGNKATAVELLERYSVNDKLPKLIKTTERNYLKKRAKKWLEIFRTENITNPLEFNDFLFKRNEGGNQWSTVSRGFLMSDLQFWSES